MTEQTAPSSRTVLPHRVIGIDLGTTTCVVSLWDGARTVVLPPLPAIVGQDSAGRVTVGVAEGSDAETAIAGVKRELGSGDRIRFRGRDYQPQEICAFILIELKRRAEVLTGEPVHDAVITVPPTYGDKERRAIAEAAGLAQLNVRRLVEEPVAAAIAAPEGTWAVYDLGGGTFDASVTTARDGLVNVLSSGGDPRLGGDDFDERIVVYALRQIRERYHVDLSQDERIRGRIRREAEIRKRELSTAETTTLELPVLTATVDAWVPLTRRAFETMIEPDLERTLGCLEAVLATAEAEHGVTRADLDGVLLVGGSTRVPMIRPLLARRLGIDPARVRADLDPDGLVARGAGLVALDHSESAVFEGNLIGLRSASLRLRSEMATPEPDPPAPADTADSDPPPGGLAAPPAETPADFRAAAESTYDLLTAASPAELSTLRTAYAAFIAAVQAAAPDTHLHELGIALRAALTWTADPGAANTYP